MASKKSLGWQHHAFLAEVLSYRRVGAGDRKEAVMRRLRIKSRG